MTPEWLLPTNTATDRKRYTSSVRGRAARRTRASGRRCCIFRSCSCSRAGGGRPSSPESLKPVSNHRPMFFLTETRILPVLAVDMHSYKSFIFRRQPNFTKPDRAWPLALRSHAKFVAKWGSKGKKTDQLFGITEVKRSVANTYLEHFRHRVEEVFRGWPVLQFKDHLLAGTFVLQAICDNTRLVTACFPARYGWKENGLITSSFF